LLLFYYPVSLTAVWLVSIVFKIFLNHLISYIACTPNTITYGPKMSPPSQGTPVGTDVKNVLSISLQTYSHSTAVDIRYEYGYDLCSLLLLESEYLDNEFEYPLSKYDIGTWSPKLYDKTFDLLYVNSCEVLPYNKNNIYRNLKYLQ
jgi:hypothetical protein